MLPSLSFCFANMKLLVLLLETSARNSSEFLKGNDGKELVEQTQFKSLSHLWVLSRHEVYKHDGENLRSPKFDVWTADFTSLLWLMCRFKDWWDFSALLTFRDWSSSFISRFSAAVPIFIICNETTPADSTIAGVLLLLLKPATNKLRIIFRLLLLFRL